MPRTLDELSVSVINYDAVVGTKFSLYVPSTILGLHKAHHGVVFATQAVAHNACAGCTAAHAAPEPIKRSCCPAMPGCSFKVFVEDTPEAQAHYIAALLEQS